MEKGTRRALHAALSPVRGVAWRAAGHRRPDYAEISGRVDLAVWDGGMLLRAGARELHLPWHVWDRLHSDIREGRTPAGVAQHPGEVLLSAGGRVLQLTPGQWAAVVQEIQSGAYADT
ncbi:hypothetical protein FAIPA1_20405 [Frankia sp. AiPs1]|uniref:hypothetical protein n=1 Tax=Frankia sp. AiPa1 TaxID=573492 RepID=UPI00202B581A|nr:hypothetical protein [Frankia sp. AiPa1]MCL9759017.1 hypothetical protein [Frankia sp. AiPa1]